MVGRSKGESTSDSHNHLKDDQYRESLEHPDITDYRTVAEVLDGEPNPHPLAKEDQS